MALVLVGAVFVGSIETVWAGTPVTDSVLTTSIKEIRQALKDPAREPVFIETRYGRGYRFIAPVTADAPDVDARSMAMPPPTRLSGMKLPVPVILGAMVGIVLLFALSIGVFWPRDEQVFARLTVQTQGLTPQLEAALHRDLRTTGLLDPTAWTRNYQLRVSLIDDAPESGILVQLASLHDGQPVDTSQLASSGMSESDIVRRISIETQALIACSDSLLADATLDGLDADLFAPANHATLSCQSLSGPRL